MWSTTKVIIAAVFNYFIFAKVSRMLPCISEAPLLGPPFIGGLIPVDDFIG